MKSIRSSRFFSIESDFHPGVAETVTDILYKERILSSSPSFPCELVKIEVMRTSDNKHWFATGLMVKIGERKIRSTKVIAV
jgi:hypothetical protein